MQNTNHNLPQDSTFIEFIAKSNLETFHSKAITWLLNKYPDFQKGFLNSILDKDEAQEAIYVKSIAEITQIDILVIYKLKNQYRFVQVENKIKASESLKKHDKYTKETDQQLLSQTEYYFLRLGNKDFCKKISQTLNLETEINNLNLVSNRTNWKFIYLKPSHVLKNKLPNLNSWRSNIFETNPWITKTYEELIINNLLHIKAAPESVQEYLSFLNQEFVSENNNLHHPDFLNYGNVKIATIKETLHLTKTHAKNNQKILNVKEVSVLHEWFHFLNADLNKQGSNINKLKLPGKQEANLEFESAFVTESGNNGGFLMEAYFLIPGFSFPFAESDKHKVARLGLQYEHNQNDAKFKLFFAAKEYDSIKIPKNKRKEYNNSIEKFLSNENFKELHNSINLDPKFNESKGKSFCSRSCPMPEYTNYNELKFIIIRNLEILAKDITRINEDTWNQLIEDIKSTQ